MKIYYYLLALLIVCSVSCRKDAPLKPDQLADPYLIQQAKDWYSSQQKLPTSSGALDLKAYTPDWSKASIVKNSKGQNVLGLSLFRSPQVYLELNVVIANGKPFGIFKKYVETKDKKDQLNIYSGKGQLITRATYNRQNHSLTSIAPPGMKVMKEKEQEPEPAPGEEPGSGGGTDPGPGPIGFSYQGPEITITIPADPPGYPDPSPSFGGGGFDIPFPSFPIGEGDPYSGFSHGGGGGGNYNPAPVAEPTDPNALDTTMTANFYRNEKAMCALNKLMQNNYYKTALNNFIGENKPIDLTFKIVPIADPLIDGETELKPSNWNSHNIDLTLNQNKIDNMPSIEVALTLLHEGVHAEIYRKLLSIHGPNNLNTMNFPSMFNLYSQYKLADGFSHEFIANYYIDIMGNALKQYDNNKFDIDYYKALAWRGLEGTDVYIGFDANKKADIQSKMGIILSNRSNSNCNDL